MKNSIEYLREVVEVAKTMGPGILDKFCDDLLKLRPDFTAQDTARITQQINQASTRIKLLKLLNYAEMASYGIVPHDLAWSLRTANLYNDMDRTEQRLELVWTGPATSSSSMRRTDQALLDLINEAKESILLVTFAAYKIPNISKALTKAASRDVRISLILESSEESEGKLTFNAMKALGERVAEQSDIFVWPHDKRPHDENGHFGSLHAKCAVIDSKTALISSANLTDYALTLNMELGIVIAGGEFPQKIQSHFEYLILAGILKKVDQ